MFRLDKFFRVCDDDELPSGEKIVVRTLSEIESNAKRDYGLAEAVRMTSALKDENSAAYRDKIAPLGDADLDSLMDILVQGRSYELDREARDLYKIDFVVPREKATYQEDIETEELQRKTEMSVYEKRARHILDGIAAYKIKLAELPRDVLMKEIKARALQVYPMATSRDAELYYTIWCAVETPDKKKVWKNPEEVRELPIAVINHLFDKYQAVDSTDPWEVTKSLTQGSSDGVGQDAGSIAT